MDALDRRRTVKRAGRIGHRGKQPFVHATGGTNDMARGEDTGAAQRLGNLIDQLPAADPTATV